MLQKDSVFGLWINDFKFNLKTSVSLVLAISVRGGGAGGAAAPPVGKKIVLFGQRHSKKYFII